MVNRTVARGYEAWGCYAGRAAHLIDLRLREALDVLEVLACLLEDLTECRDAGVGQLVDLGLVHALSRETLHQLVRRVVVLIVGFRLILLSGGCGAYERFGGHVVAVLVIGSARWGRGRSCDSVLGVRQRKQARSGSSRGAR